MSNAVKDVVSNIGFLNKYIDKEHDSLGKYSSKLFTLSNFLRANQRIVKHESISIQDREFLQRFWTYVFEHISEWKLLEEKKLYKCTLKEEYILTLSVVINAFGRLGGCLYSDNIDLSVLKGLSKIDWMRSNTEWNGRVFNEHGKIIGKEESIIKICNLLKIKLGLPLSKEEMVKENESKQ